MHRADHPLFSSLPIRMLVLCLSPVLHQASDIDVGFPAGAGDKDLLSELRRVLPDEFAQHPPDLVLYGEMR